jgi:hypothetical protein
VAVAIVVAPSITVVAVASPWCHPSKKKWLEWLDGVVLGALGGVLLGYLDGLLGGISLGLLCEHIGDTSIWSQEGIYIFKYPKGFWRSLSEISQFCFSFASIPLQL